MVGCWEQTSVHQTLDEKKVGRSREAIGPIARPRATPAAGTPQAPDRDKDAGGGTAAGPPSTSSSGPSSRQTDGQASRSVVQ